MRSVIIAVVGVWLAGCEPQDVSRQVGARCDDSLECDERCLRNDTGYTGGFCTVACDGRSDCPDDTTCADLEGGICLFTCDVDGDCQFLGETWRCVPVDLRGGGIQVKVCRG